MHRSLGDQGTVRERGGKESATRETAASKGKEKKKNTHKKPVLCTHKTDRRRGRERRIALFFSPPPKSYCVQKPETNPLSLIKEKKKGQKGRKQAFYENHNNKKQKRKARQGTIVHLRLYVDEKIRGGKA
jgi:hypothetical protein